MLPLAGFLIGFTLAALVGFGLLPGWLAVIAVVIAAPSVALMAAPPDRPRWWW